MTVGVLKEVNNLNLRAGLIRLTIDNKFATNTETIVVAFEILYNRPSVVVSDA